MRTTSAFVLLFLSVAGSPYEDFSLRMALREGDFELSNDEGVYVLKFFDPVSTF